MVFARRTLALWIGFTGAVALTALAGLPPHARGDVPTARDYVGRWTYTGGEEGQRQISRAIDHAVTGLPVFIEAAAADRVEEGIGPFRELRFALDGDRLTFSADDWGPVTSRLGGPAVTVRGPDGTRLSLTQRLTPRGELVQTLEQSDGTRRNTFALTGDGNTARLDVSIASPMLPNDVDYHLLYRRRSADRRQATR